MTHPITTYLHELTDKLATGEATEHTYRPALAAFLESFSEDIHAINEASRAECGAPDIKVEREGFSVGYLETKDIGAPLDREEASDQLHRYRSALDNLILTDYLEFRWFVNGEHRRTVRLARGDARGELQVEANGRENLEGLLGDFLAHEPQPISSPRELAERMARLTHLIRDVIINAFQTGQASELLTGWRQAFADVLIPDLDQPEHLSQFADMFAQTLSYGLFSARIMHQTGEFSRHTAQDYIPRTNPFLRDFFSYITGSQLSDEPYVDLVNDLIQVLAMVDMHAILADFGRDARQDDPMMHFYETFLMAYDPHLREQRGVYYTPMPVVSFIVRSVDEVLKTRFNLPRGLADTTRLPDGTHKVLVLDPAVGTATFLYAVIDLIRDEFMARGDAGMWSGYVREHLLDRIFGFEIMMAPYAIAHFKLALQLAGYDLDLPEEQRQRWAYDFQADDRIRVYLTNTLEVLPEEIEGEYGPMQFVAKEAKAADAVKQDKPIMVVLGNPPYSGQSVNDNPWINGLLKGGLPDGTIVDSYYQVDGHPLQERNTKWLQDDYVKFIRFGQWRIDQTGSGVLAFISNSGYLNNPTFRGMRQSLINCFNTIYILNLHGSVRRDEIPPDNINDRNVFDIQQGVSIVFFIKDSRNNQGTPGIYYYDLWGERQEKYEWLVNNSFISIDWQKINPQSPFYLFYPVNRRLNIEYQIGYSITDIFKLNSVGVVTARDHFTIDVNKTVLWQRMKDFASIEIEKAREKYSLRKDVNDWKVAWAQQDIKQDGPNENHIIKIHYRPFDIRYTYFTGNSRGILCRPRCEIMGHMIDYENIGIITGRSNKSDSMNHFFVSQFVSEAKCGEVTTQSAIFPIYLYQQDTSYLLFDFTATSPWPPDPEHGNRVPNLDPGFVAAMEEKLGLTFDPHLAGRDHPVRDAFGPEDILAYIYAVFHSPTYRERYAEFLKIDFPRVPLTADADLFRALVSLGRELLSLHLMESPRLFDLMTHYPVPGDDVVAPRGGYPKYTPPEGDAGGKVFINREQYFEGVPPEVWAFEIGGYQVLHKWLKDRRGRELDYDDKEHYQRVVVALAETIRLMAAVDAAIPAWPF